MENFKKEFVEILNEAIEHFDSSIEDDMSTITIIADVDNDQLVFGGSKLKDDLEEEGEYDENSRVFYTAKSKYLKDCYKTINKDYEAYEKKKSFNYDVLVSHSSKLFDILSQAIDAEPNDKFDGLLFYGWSGVMKQMVDSDNFWTP